MTTQDTTLAGYGPFAAAFEAGDLSAPGYLLLGSAAGAAEVHSVLDRIDRALSAGPAEPFIIQMLAGMDWRPHIVAAAALLAAPAARVPLEHLWRPLDSGSAVIPQLAVTALLTDSDFPERARSRVEQLFRAAPPPIERRYPLTVEEGRQWGMRRRGAKIIASLLEASSSIPSMSAWLAEARARPEVIELLRTPQGIRTRGARVVDVPDDGPALVVGWQERIRAIFAERGVVLCPKAA